MNLHQNSPVPSHGYGGEYGYGGYGYGYGGYGYGYGAGYGYGYGGHGGGSANQTTISDIILILRERIWYIVVIFLVVMSLTLVYTFSRTKIYEAGVSLNILRREITISAASKGAAPITDIMNSEDFNTVVEVLKSGTIVGRVAERLTGEELRQFMAPYERGKGEDPIAPAAILGQNRSIIPLRMTLFVRVQYRHPDRIIAAKVANYFAEEFIAYNSIDRTKELLGVGEQLKIHLKQQQDKVKQLAEELQEYKERNKAVSLDPNRDIINDKLKQKNAQLSGAEVRLKECEVRWKQVKERLDNKAELAELSFIRGQSIIDLLTKDVANKKIFLAQLSERYKEKHPSMMEARNALAQSERELTRELDNAAAIIQSEYQIASKALDEARKDLASAEQESLELGRAAVEYESKVREYRVQEVLLNDLIAKTGAVIMDTAGGDIQKVRIVDRAGPPSESDYVSPNVLLNLGVGVAGGLVLGLGFAFFIAYIDDRVKSSFDIETVVGLPLIGIIPKIKKMSQADKAQIAASHLDSHVTEAFLSLHSNLRLNELSKNAKCILVTSSIPGEGKSFTVTNLAITMAAHGERGCIVDCDLRKPNIHRSFGLDNTKGVIDVCAGAATIDDVAVTGLHENLSVIMTGGRAKNPTQILSSREFESFVIDLRKRYDRVFFDTPPIVAVSDSLIIMPLVDGAIFAVYFNKVRRKVAQFSARKLMDTKMPVFGAVLNGLTASTSGYYYAQYAQKSTYGYGGYHTHQPVAAPAGTPQMGQQPIQQLPPKTDGEG
ncbi:MAG: polysaccharide biosynthesis tyrosine autokinase [Opitutaceae bacterium]|jgi:capsular exopolysaccharide synthesis family protein|nr:polysaccharide biosynthesis tyrosine autokinase [Opitutaceae bacterium]